MRLSVLVSLTALASFAACVDLCSSTTINHLTQIYPPQCVPTEHTRDGAQAADTSSTTASADVSSLPELESQPTTPDSASASSTRSHEAAETVQTSAEQIDDEDGDPLSDQNNFLSFQEWRAQMLEQAGQSPDHIVGATGHRPGAADQRRRATGINNALESLGDDGEIEIDFSGFVNHNSDPRSEPVQVSGGQEAVSGSPNDTPAIRKRSKEAGTTSQERFNYASFDCAATVLKTNSGSKGAIRILTENKDAYLINKCADESKYFIVELCNDILIDTIVLGNFEFFSSTFRTFRVSISDRYPVKAEKWREIGTFEARNTRGVQAFMVEDGLIWARYLKVELLTHYGREYYCPVSLLRVHGTTMMDDYRNEMKEQHEQDEDDDETGLITGGEEIAAPPEVVPIAPIKTVDVQVVDMPRSTADATLTPEASQESMATMSITSEGSNAASTSAVEPEHEQVSIDSSEAAKTSADTPTESETVGTPPPTIPPTIPQPEQTVSPNTAAAGRSEHDSYATMASNESANATMTIPVSDMAYTNTTNSQAPSLEREILPESSPSAPVSDAVPSTSVALQNTTESSTVPAAADSTVPQVEASIAATKAQNATASASKTKPRVPSVIKASPATPSTQDSFFRSVHKRLLTLESNSSLSLQYIEEQSRILRDAFAKAEKKQMQKISKFLETLDDRPSAQLSKFQQEQNSILEQYRRDLEALSERSAILAASLVRMERSYYSLIVLIVILFGLILFNANAVSSISNQPLELSFMQSIQHLRRNDSRRSYSKGYSNFEESDPGTPSGLSRPTSMGAMFGRSSGHRRNLSDGLTSDEVATNPTPSPDKRRKQGLHVRMHSDATTIASGGRSKSPSVSFRMDTPSSEHEETTNGTRDGDGDGNGNVEVEVDMPEVDPAALKRAASSPPLGRQTADYTDDEVGSETLESEMNGRVNGNGTSSQTRRNGVPA